MALPSPSPGERARRNARVTSAGTEAMLLRAAGQEECSGVHWQGRHTCRPLPVPLVSIDAAILDSKACQDGRCEQVLVCLECTLQREHDQQAPYSQK